MAEQKTDPQVRLLQQVALTAFLWAATFVATKGDWARDVVDLPRRVALVAIGIGGFLPVVYVYAKSIRMQDEFNQRIHLVSLGVAFAITAVVSYAADLLRQAHFIREVPSGGVWALMIAIWFVSIVLTTRYYR
jgi:hypothetical protein